MEPLFSVIIPLEWHRGRWEQCVQAWQAQTLGEGRFELVLVVPPDFEFQQRLHTLLAESDCRSQVVTSDLSHDMGLCALGAEHARGEFLFFTESHCWPESDVLAICVRAFNEHADWAGFSCRSLPSWSSRLGAAEAEMYDRDITYGMTVHPWRKILDQCFVTRRDAYVLCGGFKSEFGHFAEWALAANYHALGLSLGYVSEAQFHHQYVGNLSELRGFSLDFLRGEQRYLAEAREPGVHLIERPDEWIDRGNYDRTLARALLRPSTTRRWLLPAIFGDRLLRLRAALATITTKTRVLVASKLGSTPRLIASFKSYQAALQHQQRLWLIAEARKVGQHAEHAGLHHAERSAGVEFRWSEPAAAVRLELPMGMSRVVIECAPLVSLPSIEQLRFELNGQAISRPAVHLERFRAVVEVEVDRAGWSTLSWACSRFDAPSDPRALGLPVANISITDRADRTAARLGMPAIGGR